jgi:ribosomal protein L22
VAVSETQEVRAQAKWVRTSARKARLVAEHIRGRSVPEARAVLAFTPRAAAREMEKVLRSAVANAEANHGLLGDELVVCAAYVDEGPTLKRWRARARGRVARIRKRTCHITLVVKPAPERPGAALKRGRRAGAEAAPVQAEPKRRLPAPRRPATRKPKAESNTVAGAEATETTASAPETPAEKPKPKRRAPVRRKKTKDEGSES